MIYALTLIDSLLNRSLVPSGEDAIKLREVFKILQEKTDVPCIVTFLDHFKERSKDAYVCLEEFYETMAHALIDEVKRSRPY